MTNKVKVLGIFLLGMFAILSLKKMHTVINSQSLMHPPHFVLFLFSTQALACQ